MRDFYLRWWCGNEPIVGIDFRDEQVLCAKSATLADVGESAKLFAIPLPSGVIEKGLIKDAARLVSILKESHYFSELSGCRCAVAISSAVSFTACLEVPDSMLCANQSDAYAWALNRLSLDSSNVTGKAYLKNAQLFLVVVKLVERDRFKEIFLALGLELACLTLRSLALHNGAAVVCKRSRQQVTMWIDLTDSSPALHLFEGKGLRFSRCFNEGLSGGVANFVSQLCEELQELDVSGYAEGDIVTLCAGSAKLMQEFTDLWRDRVLGTRHGQLSRYTIVENLQEDTYQDPYLIATGLGLLLRELE